MGSLKLTTASSGSVILSPSNTASDVTITVPAVTGTMLTTASSGQVIPKAALPTGSVLQVVQATKTDAVGLACTSTWTNIPAQGGSGTFGASITPTSATSKILVLVDLHGGASAGQVTRTRLLRDGSAIYAGDSAGSRPLGFGQLYPNGGTVEIGALHASYLDSPATTSSVTYTLQAGTDNTSGVAYINQSARDNNGTGYDTRTASSIILMEIAA